MLNIGPDIKTIENCNKKDTIYLLEEDLGPDSIQKWCEELDGKSRCELNENQRYIARICRMNKELVKKRWEAELHFNPNHCGKTIMSVIKERHTYTIDYACALFLSRLIYVPLAINVYTTFIQYKCWQHGIKELDFKKLMFFVFPDGVFYENTLNEMYQKQRYIPEGKPNHRRDMLDNPKFMQSIIELK